MIDRIQWLINELNRLTELYDLGTPEISDSEWDKMYFELQTLENQTGIYYPDSPTQKVYYETKSALEKVTHDHPMLSLDKTKDMKEVYSFLGDRDYITMCKMDGLTCSLRYLNGNLVSAETRGNGEIGENILHNVLTINNVPKRIEYYDELIVDGEIICTYDNFKLFEDDYQNPRNFAAGSIRLLDSRECAKRTLTFVAWDVIKGFSNKKYLSEKLKELVDLNFTVVPWLGGDDWDAKEYLVKKADEYQYPIDGLVFKFDDIEYGESLGSTGHHKKNAIAFKFEDETFDTNLKWITWTMGRTGILTPVAIFEPVEIDFTTVERASLHNISIMRETLGDNPYVGEPIQVFKANQIIPQILPVDDDVRDCEGQNAHSELKECPYCGHPVELIISATGVENYYCDNPNCGGKISESLDYFCSNSGLNIMYISTEIIQDLIDFGYLKSKVDLFRLSDYRHSWANKQGYGLRSVDRILNAIEKAKTTTLDKFIASLAIDLIGPSMAKELCKVFETYEDFRDACQNNYSFESIPSFGDVKAKALRSFDFTEANEIVKYLTISNPYFKAKEDLKLNGMTFVVTGSLNKFKNRDELVGKIEELGGKVAGSVSKKTNYLINNDVESASSKNQKAKSLGIPIISEEEFCERFLV